MARLDVYPMPGQARLGFVIDVQAKLLDHLSTRAVVPLMPQVDAPLPIKDLNPIFVIDGEPFVMLTQAIATVPTKELRGVVTSFDSRHDEITRALDVPLIGF